MHNGIKSYGKVKGPIGNGWILHSIGIPSIGSAINRTTTSSLYQTRCSQGCYTNTFVSEQNIHSLRQRFFVEISSKHCLSLTVRARELKFGDNVHRPLHVTCHASHVMCNMSHVTFFHIKIFLIKKPTIYKYFSG